MHNPEQLVSPARQLLSVSSEDVGQRLDRYLVGLLSDVSRSQLQTLIAEGAIQVNGKLSKPGYALRVGDEVLVDLAASSARVSQAKANPLPLDIIYEDADLLVVNKAPGMVVHPAPGHSEGTLVNALLAYYPQIQESEQDQRPGIVHRLDRDTSGLLIVAKNVRAQAALVEQMQRHEIIKQYLALVEGNIALDQGSIDAPIGRDPRHRQQMAITATGVGSREARTHFRVLERFARHTLLLVQLETGRTHQIRVHLKAIGHPVVGDPTYGSGTVIRGSNLQRQFLHSYQLQFAHPLTGEALQFEAPLPADLQKVLDRKNFL
ncbi:MAG TPA: RluA family pseudouridine synthase [Ktedonobacteraceae bacterium]|jgi:23S rRNA pseudouridine1911/1915/1917 synthase